MNKICIAFWFAGFIVSVSLFAQTPAGPPCNPQNAGGQSNTGVVLRVIDATNATIAKAHIVVRNQIGCAVVSGNTNQDGLLRLPRLAEGSYVFSVSAMPVFQEFQRLFSLGPDQTAELEITLKDRCYIDPNLNCDDFTTAPPFVDVIGIHPQSPVTFCDLVRNPEKYSGQMVTVRVAYRYGFEWSELFCIDCLDKGKAWLDTARLDDDASVRSFRKMPKGAGIVNLTLQGVFMSGGTFGHLGGYRYQITADKISDVKIIQKGMKPLAEEERVEKKWACGGTDPK